MANIIEPMEILINEFSKLPGVGKKTAQRYAYHIINGSMEQAQEFATAITNAKENIHFCSKCGNWTNKELCDNCSKPNLEPIICVVKEPKDVVAIDKANSFNGTFHVLHGTINPMANIGPNDIRIKELLDRITNQNIKEVIVATNPDVEGEATAMYIAKLIKPLEVKVTRLAHGIPVGSEIEYTDDVTLARAFVERNIL